MRDGEGEKDELAKSTVAPKGVPSSSFREYRFPIEALESSTRQATPAFRILRAIRIQSQSRKKKGGSQLERRATERKRRGKAGGRERKTNRSRA